MSFNFGASTMKHRGQIIESIVLFNVYDVCDFIHCIYLFWIVYGFMENTTNYTWFVYAHYIFFEIILSMKNDLVMFFLQCNLSYNLYLWVVYMHR